MEKANTERNTSLDLLTVIASFLVVLLHQSASVQSDIYVYRIIAECAVPLFVMKSGALLLEESKMVDYVYIRKSIIKTAVIIAFWGMVYNLISNFMIYGVSIEVVFKSIYAVVSADTSYNYQFWYMYMLLGLYAMTPIIRKMTHELYEKDYIYIIATGVAICFLIPFICGLVGVDYQSIWIEKWCAPFSYMLLYYIIGHYLFKHPMPNKTIIYLCLVAIGLGAVTLICSIEKIGGDNIDKWLTYFSPFTLTYTVTLFSMLNKLNWKHSKGQQRAINVLAKYGLGIYILHPMVIVAMRKILGIDVNSFIPSISVPVLTVIVYLLCAIATWGLKKIPIIRHVI